jgi:hypothetical protein
MVHDQVGLPLHDKELSDLEVQQHFNAWLGTRKRESERHARDSVVLICKGRNIGSTEPQDRDRIVTQP